MTTIQNLIEQLEQMRLEIESEMRDQMGTATMCEVHKDGRVTGGLKYHEGRLVLVGDILREIKRLPQEAVSLTSTDSITAILDATAPKWESQLARFRDTERPSMTWVAYSQGGVDALVAIREMVSSQITGDQ